VADDKNKAFNVWYVIAGFCVRTFTPWITWVHEWMHGVVAAFMGGRATEIHQTVMRFTLPDMSRWHIVVLMGFWLEMFLYFGVAMLFGQRFVSKVAAGIVPAVLIRGLISDDFYRVQSIYPLNEAVFVIVGAALCVILLYRHYEGVEYVSSKRAKSVVSKVKY